MGQVCCCRHRLNRCCSNDPKVLLDEESGGALFLFLSSAEGQHIQQHQASKTAAKALLTCWEYHNALLKGQGKPTEVVSSIHAIKIVGLGEVTWASALRYIRIDASFAKPKAPTSRSRRGSPARSARRERRVSTDASYFVYRETPPNIVHYKSSSTGFSAVKALDVPEYGAF